MPGVVSSSRASASAGPQAGAAGVGVDRNGAVEDPSVSGRCSTTRGAGTSGSGLAVTETAIAEHGSIGDLHTAALVSTDGSIALIDAASPWTRRGHRTR